MIKRTLDVQAVLNYMNLDLEAIMDEMTQNPIFQKEKTIARFRSLRSLPPFLKLNNVGREQRVFK